MAHDLGKAEVLLHSDIQLSLFLIFMSVHCMLTVRKCVLAQVGWERTTRMSCMQMSFYAEHEA